MAEARDQMMSLAEVRRFFGGDDKPLGASTIYDWVRSGKLPQPIRLSKSLSRWRRSDCEAALKKIQTAEP